MADSKISSLSELTSYATDDLLAIVDTTASPQTTKKIAISSLNLVDIPAAAEGYLSLELGVMSSQVSLLPTNSGSVRVHAMSDCLINFGDSSVTADQTTSIYMAAGTEIFGLPSGAGYIAARAMGESGLLSITGLDTTYKQQLTTNTMTVVESGSNCVELPSGTYIRLFSMTDCFIEFGDEYTVADNQSMFFEAGTEIVRVPSAATHLAVKRYTLNGGLYISGVN